MLPGNYTSNLTSHVGQVKSLTTGKSNISPIFKKGRQENPGNYRWLSTTSVPEKIIEQILLAHILRHIKDTKVT